MFFLLGSLLIFFSGCSTSLEYYKDSGPKLNFMEFFNGQLVAHGFFKDRFNKVKKTFVVDMNCIWTGNKGILTEYFTYNDGTKFKRVWNLTSEGGKIRGTAHDVVGEAVGEISGNALHWVYDVDLEVGSRIYRVKFDDWIYLIDQKTILNQSYVSKFGFDIGEVVLSIRKKE